jgi:hydrogenase expression/formation protein HypC
MDRDSPVAWVCFGGVRKLVNLAFVPKAREGDYVLVHVGVAISRVDEAEAREVFRYLEEIDALSPELQGGEGEDR